MSERRDPLPYVAGWGLLGGALGLSLHLAARLTGHHSAGIATAGVLGGVAVGLTSWLAVRERAADSRLGLTLQWAPVALAIPSMLGLGLTATLAMRDATAAVVAAGATLGILIFARRAADRQAIDLAVHRWRSEGDDTGLRWVSTRSWLGVDARDHARHGLGMAALEAGDVVGARAHLEAIQGKRLGPHHHVSLALLDAIDGRYADAEAHLQRVDQLRDRRKVRTSLAAVRTLLTLRTDPEGAAARFAAAPAEGPLARALAAWHAWKADELHEAFDLLDPTTRSALEHNGLRHLVPEVDEVLRALGGSNDNAAPQ